MPRLEKFTHAVIDHLVATGAILYLPEHSIYILIGYWDWINRRQIFYFDAVSDNEFGAHVLDFYKVESPDNLGAEFYDSKGKLIAYLSTIEEADTDALDAYRFDWEQWDADRESKLPFLESLKTRLCK